MYLFHITKEAEDLKAGFNFYPLSDKGSFGFRLKFSKSKIFWCRYSKRRHNWIIKLYR